MIYVIDMSFWQQQAALRIHDRIAAPGRLSGKIAIVTGGAQGFGLGIAASIYREGASVIIADINSEAAEAAAQSLGERACSVFCDVSK